MLLLSMILGLGCRPTLNMKITVPAQVSIDPSVTKIAVVDRVGNEYTKRETVKKKALFCEEVLSFCFGCTLSSRAQ